jgi:hypothetical protein
MHIPVVIGNGGGARYFGDDGGKPRLDDAGNALVTLPVGEVDTASKRGGDTTNVGGANEEENGGVDGRADTVDGVAERGTIGGKEPDDDKEEPLDGRREIGGGITLPPLRILSSSSSRFRAASSSLFHSRSSKSSSSSLTRYTITI